MGKIVGVVNRKGGVGKTTLSVGLAEAFVSEYSKHTIVVDLDPQASASRFLLNEEGAFESAIKKERTLTGLLRSLDGDVDAASDPVIQKMVHRIKERAHIALALLANSDDYWDFEIGQIRAGLDSILTDNIKSLLQLLAERYDLVIVDCPPGQSLAAEAAIQVSDLVLCPITPERMAVWGKELLEQYLYRVAPKANVRFVVTRKQSNALANDIFDEITSSGKLLTTPGGGTASYLVLSQTKQFQDRIEIGGINIPLQRLWGSKAVREIKAVAASVRKELSA